MFNFYITKSVLLRSEGTLNLAVYNDSTLLVVLLGAAFCPAPIAGSMV